MIRSTVIVEGVELDLIEDVATDFTYSIQDIREPDKRTTDFSKTIELPGTPKNNALFAHIFDLNVENTYNPAATNIGYNYNPNKTAKAIVLVDGIQVFNGVIRILKVTIEKGQVKYETNVLGRLADILYAFGDSKLSDIDFSDLNHSLTASWIQGVWNNPNSYPYTYPLIDYGLSVDGVNYPIQNFAPAIRVKEYIDRMFAQAGFTYNCSFFNLPYFKNLIIPNTEKVEFTQSSTSARFLEQTSEHKTNTNGRTGKWQEVTNWWGPPRGIDKYGMIAALTGSDSDSRTFVKFTRDIETSVQFKLRYLCTRTGYINIRLNGEVIANLDAGTYEVFPHTATIEIEKRQFFTGDILTMSMDTSPKCKITFYPESSVIMPSPNDTSTYPVDEGADIIMTDFVSKSIAQKDFFKSIILMHNLYVFTDPDNDKNLFITPQVWFYDTYAGDAVDWTYKIDYSKEIEIVPMGELTAREFLFTYKEDSDYWNSDKYKKIYNEVYGQLSYIVDNDFEKDTKKIELIFSPSPMVDGVRVGNKDLRVIPHIYKVGSDLAKERDAFNIRILQYGDLQYSYADNGSDYATWYITDSTGAVLLSTVKYPYAGMWDNPTAPSRSLEFGPPKEIYFKPPSTGYPDVGLYRFYWEDFINEVSNKDSKLWRGYAFLTPSDINQLDFKKLVKVDNIYFKLNKIDGYSPLTNDVTRVELFKTVVQVEIVKPGFILHEDGGYLIHDDGSSRIPYA